MSLVKCKECGQEISDTANKCPNCGAPTPKNKKSKLIIIAIIIFILFIFISYVNQMNGPYGDAYRALDKLNYDLDRINRGY
jgi:predicted amidophosphoribosyltransferase